MAQLIRKKPSPSLSLVLVAVGLIVTATGAAQTNVRGTNPAPQFSGAKAFDVSAPLYSLASARALNRGPLAASASQEPVEIRPEGGPDLTQVMKNHTFSGDAALQRSSGLSPLAATPTISAPSLTFEGLSNQDNFNIFGFRVNPPDPVGAVGPHHYVEMINLVFGVYDKKGNLLLGPVDSGTLWAGFAIPDCTDPSGDPVVLYDQLEDRWLLSQFTTRGLSDPTLPFYNCVAISATGDPTGAYYRYAFETTVGGKFYFPDYPKYGVWSNSYLLTSRDFGPTTEYGISVYALEKEKMLHGDPSARSVHFFLDSAVVPIYLIGDGLLPATIDGERGPKKGAPAPIAGTMDDGGPYGAPFDALNLWQLSVQWKEKAPVASLGLAAQLPVAPFDSVFPCGVVPSTTAGVSPTGRDCLPEPGVRDGSRFLDVLSIRQRPTWRLAYRNFGTYEALVTSGSVQALPNIAGMRWYEIRRNNIGQFSLFQQGTYAGDGVDRWMGSIAMDHRGNVALGYSVVNGTDIFPGIRYTGRRASDPLGQMTLGEGTIIDGTGVQITTNSRWGDYTSMNVDPNDDCTFWYVNEYYQVSGIIGVNTAPWQTRVASFKLPKCED